MVLIFYSKFSRVFKVFDYIFEVNAILFSELYSAFCKSSMICFEKQFYFLLMKLRWVKTNCANFNCMSVISGFSPIHKSEKYTGFGWERINFLHSTLYGAMFWIFDQKSVNNRDFFAVAEQKKYSRLFLVPRLPHQQVGWESTRSWEGT